MSRRLLMRAPDALRNDGCEPDKLDVTNKNGRKPLKTMLRIV